MTKVPSKIGLFPGTFDPLTNGHMDVIRRGRVLFDQLTVAIGHNPTKQLLFSMDERLEMTRQLVEQEGFHDVHVACFEGLTVDYAREIGASAILRGLRNVTDLNFEFQLALTNRAVADIETVFIMTGESYAFTSSSLIRQIAAAGDVESLHKLLPPLVLKLLKAKKEKLGDGIASIRIDGCKE